MMALHHILDILEVYEYVYNEFPNRQIRRNGSISWIHYSKLLNLEIDITYKMLVNMTSF